MSLLSAKQVYLNQDFTSKEAVFHFLAEEIVNAGIATDQQGVIDGLLAREAESTTGMMDGFAIPHAKSAKIISPAIFIVSLTKGIDWTSLDGKPTDFVIALFIPEENQGEDYLKILSQVAKMLMHDDIKTSLKAATAPEQVIEILENHIEM